MDVNQRIEQKTDRLTDDLIRIRRRIHENPELGFEEVMRRLLEGLKAGMRVDYELDYQPGVPLLRNNKEVLARVLEGVRNILGADNVQELPEGSMGSEDFAYFTERFPGAHLRIGSKIDGLETALHRSNFTVNELPIPTGVRAVSRAAVHLLS